MCGTRAVRLNKHDRKSVQLAFQKTAGCVFVCYSFRFHPKILYFLLLSQITKGSLTFPDVFLEFARVYNECRVVIIYHSIYINSLNIISKFLSLSICLVCKLLDTA